MMMTGRIVMDNGTESVFSLTDDDVKVLEQDVAEVRKATLLMNDMKAVSHMKDYNIADELAYAAHKWVEQLRERQLRRKERKNEQEIAKESREA